MRTGGLIDPWIELFPAPERIVVALDAYLGDKWEHLFALGGMRLRAYGDAPLAAGRHWLELPRRDLWIF